MKNISLSLVALVLSVTAVNTTHAQTAAVFTSNVTVINDENSNNDAAGIDARAIKNFKKDFSSVENARWQQLTDGFMSKFVQKNIQFRIGYNLKGDWQYTERTYMATELPIDIRKQVEHAYVGYTISLVEEITTRKQTVYLVRVENEEWTIKIKTDGTDIETLEEFKKAD